jgi:hypothetical protein
MTEPILGVTVIAISAGASSIQDSIDNPAVYLRDAGRTIGRMATESI